MEKNEFKGIDIPEQITDPEDREFFALLRKAQEIAIKKEVPFLVHTILLSSKTSISLAVGCPHCISIILKVAMEKDPKLLDILMKAVSMHMIDKLGNPGKGPGIEQLIDYAKKNTPAGN